MVTEPRNKIKAWKTIKLAVQWWNNEVKGQKMFLKKKTSNNAHASGNMISAVVEENMYWAERQSYDDGWNTIGLEA